MFRNGRKRVGKNLSVWVLEGQGDRRLGVIIPKSTAANAVSRNRLKRVIRESWRKQADRLAEDAWVVVSVRRGAGRELDLVGELQEALEECHVAK